MSTRLIIIIALTLAGFLLNPWFLLATLGYIALLSRLYRYPEWSREGRAFLEAWMYEDAERVYRKALEQCEKDKRDDLIGEAYWCLAEALELRGELDQAHGFYIKALETIESHFGPKDKYIGMILDDQIVCALKLKKLDEVEKIYARMESSGLLSGKRFLLRRARALFCLAACQKAHGDSETSRRTSERAIESFEKSQPSLTEFYDFASFAADRLLLENPTMGAAELYRRVLAVPKQAKKKLQDIPAIKGEQVDNYHGVDVSDPFRWLENGDSQEVKDWVRQKSNYATDYLAEMEGRYPLSTKWRSLLIDMARSLPLKAGDRYFLAIEKRSEINCIIYSQASLDDEPTVAFDPNRLIEGGNTSVESAIISSCGRYAAYSVSVGGSDWTEWRIHDLSTETDLPESIRWTWRGHVTWSADSKGFFYTKMNRPDAASGPSEEVRFPSVCYHALGTPQSEDRILYERPDTPDLLLSTVAALDGKLLFIVCESSTAQGNGIVLVDLSHDTSEPVQLFETGDWAYYCLPYTHEDRLYLLTNREAPNYRIVSLSIQDALSGTFSLDEVIAESDASISEAGLRDGNFLILYQEAGESHVKELDLKGNEVNKLELPPNSTICLSFTCDNEAFIQVSDPLTPRVHYRYDLNSKLMTEIYRLEPSFDPTRYILEKVSYRSKDGTLIPMLISRRKDLARDGDNPAILYGYGGYGIPVTPMFSSRVIAWMDLGGVYCMPAIRGGGDFGRRWHAAGKGRKKQNSFDDFIAAAEWLIEDGYTSPEKLAAKGGSNGGLVVAAAITQRPDLFAAASVESGVLDMLRFHKYALGWFAVNEYGSPDDPEDFAALYAYSPVHRAKPGIEYPATLISAGTNDTRLPPLHSYKFAAALGDAQAGRPPILLYVEEESGHLGGARRSSRAIDELCFLAEHTGIDILARLSQIS